MARKKLRAKSVKFNWKVFFGTISLGFSVGLLTAATFIPKHEKGVDGGEEIATDTYTPVDRDFTEVPKPIKLRGHKPPALFDQIFFEKEDGHFMGLKILDTVNKEKFDAIYKTLKEQSIGEEDGYFIFRANPQEVESHFYEKRH